ncbi:TetR/AcrR family transcriptional regulator C-terminal domain-containing protein [Spirillospora sp. NPDC049652]
MSSEDEQPAVAGFDVAATPLPEPPWRAGSRSRSAAPRVPLTREAIVDAAIRVLDRTGLDSLSMRAVGEELGTGSASIYWHVRNKGELLQLIVERVMGGVRLPEPDPFRWEQQLRGLAADMRAAMNSHRDIARISMGRVPFGPTTVRFIEWLFQLLGPVGVPDKVISYVGDVFALYIGAHAFEESLGVVSPIGEEMAPEAVRDMFGGYLAALPADRFPNVRRLGDRLFDNDVEARFDFGVDLLLLGLRRYAGPDGSDAPDGAGAPRP